MPSRPVESSRPLILVVEDDPGVREPLEKFLTMHGFEIVAAESVEAAQERLRERRIQGAVIDLRLPEGKLGMSYLLALEDYFFVYPTKLREYQARYRGAFLHGGVSPEEVVLPVALLMPRRS